MTFVRLGAVNAWRNLTRSLFAMMSIAVAAGFLTYSVSLSRGYAQQLYDNVRSYLGGEIILHAVQVDAGLSQSEEGWEYRLLQPQNTTDFMAMFYPEVVENGYLARNDMQFTQERMKEIGNTLGIAEVYPFYQMPVLVRDNYGQWPRSLRGRDARLDRSLEREPRSMMRSGRWFNEGEDEYIAVVSTSDNMHETVDESPGKILHIQVPRVRFIDGQYTFDFTDLLQYEFTIIGTQRLSTRNLELDEPGRGPVLPLQWNFDDIQIPLPTWERIWQDAAGDIAFHPTALGLVVEDMPYLEDTVVALAREYPEHTVISVPNLVGKVHQQGIVEQVERALRNFEESLQFSYDIGRTDAEQFQALSVLVTRTRKYNEQLAVLKPAAMPQDLRMPINILICLNSALIVAANLLIMVSERAKEIGILKSLGSQRKEIMMMVLTEASILALLGCIAGFMFMRVPSVLNQVIRETSWLLVLQRFLEDFLVVIGAVTGATLVFALFPALRMANLVVMETLRHE